MAGLPLPALAGGSGLRGCMKILEMTGAALGLCVLLLSASGCDTDTRVELHEPGQYKGARDPLLDVAGTPEFSSKLQQRLQQVQTDR